MTTLPPHVRPAGTSATVRPRPGATASFVADGAATGGAYALVEWVHEAGVPGPSPHVHRAAEEAFYVVDGTLELRLGDATTRLSPGGFALVPRGTLHTFAVPDGGACRFLILFSPPGTEAFFAALAEASGDGAQPVPAEVMRRVGAPFGVDVPSS